MKNVNREIKTFDSKLKKIAKLFNYVTVLEFTSNRNLSLNMVCIRMDLEEGC